jgi:hypothetical protein
VLFEKDTFKISRLKELMIREARKKLQITTHKPNNQYGGYCINVCLREITIGEEKVNFDYIKFEITKNCQILQIDGKGWLKGKLNIEVCISPNDKTQLDKVNLKFFPEQPIESESPLDDIREMVQTN